MTSVTAEQLCELHRIHQQLADLNDRLKRGPRQVNAGKHAVTLAEQALSESREAWKKMRMESDEQQLQLRQRGSKIVELDRKLNECKTNTEFSALKNQIAAEQKASSVLEDEIFEKLERLDGLQAEINQTDDKLATSREELKKTEDRVNGQQATLQSELDRVNEMLVKAEADLPPDFKVDYQRVVQAHGPDGLAPLDGDSCGGCHVMLTPQTINELHLSKTIFCRSCGCVLYLDEDRVGA